MKFKGTFVEQLSGSLAAITASHNKFGTYLRTRAVPTNPNSPAQAQVRQIFGQLATLWSTVLTQLQRDAWTTYAANVTVLDPLGESINLTPMNMYIRSNTSRVQNGLTRIDDGPTEFNKGDFTLPTITSIVTPDTLTLAFESTDAWADEDNAAMLLYASRQQGPGIVFFRGPYRKTNVQILGDSVTPPTNPAVIALPFVGAVGNTIFMRINVTRADGRLSEETFLESVVT